MTVITATFSAAKPGILGITWDLGGKGEGKQVKTWLWRARAPPQASHTHKAPHGCLAALEHQQPWKPRGSGPQFDRREKPAEGRELVSSDRGAIGTEPALELSLPLSQTGSLMFGVWLLACAKCLLLSRSLLKAPFSLAHSLLGIWGSLTLASVSG